MFYLWHNRKQLNRVELSEFYECRVSFNGEAWWLSIICSLYSGRSWFVMKVSDCFAACLIYWHKGKKGKYFLYGDAAIVHEPALMCLMVVYINLKLYRCWWRILQSSVLSYFGILSHKILWHFNSPRRYFQLSFAAQHTNFAIIFYERWEIENKIELCENCWTQKMRFLDRISVRFGRMAKAISA